MTKASMKLPSATWTITYIDHEDGSATVENFDAEDNDGYLFAKTIQTITSFNTNDEGVLIGFGVGEREFSVRNPQPIMTYKLPL